MARLIASPCACTALAHAARQLGPAWLAVWVGHVGGGVSRSPSGLRGGLTQALLCPERALLCLPPLDMRHRAGVEAYRCRFVYLQACALQQLCASRSCESTAACMLLVVGVVCSSLGLVAVPVLLIFAVLVLCMGVRTCARCDRQVLLLLAAQVADAVHIRGGPACDVARAAGAHEQNPGRVVRRLRGGVSEVVCRRERSAFLFGLRSPPGDDGVCLESQKAPEGSACASTETSTQTDKGERPVAMGAEEEDEENERDAVEAGRPCRPCARSMGCMAQVGVGSSEASTPTGERSVSCPAASPRRDRSGVDTASVQHTRRGGVVFSRTDGGSAFCPSMAREHFDVCAEQRRELIGLGKATAPAVRVEKDHSSSCL